MRSKSAQCKTGNYLKDIVNNLAMGIKLSGPKVCFTLVVIHRRFVVFFPTEQALYTPITTDNENPRFLRSV